MTFNSVIDEVSWVSGHYWWPIKLEFPCTGLLDQLDQLLQPEGVEYFVWEFIGDIELIGLTLYLRNEEIRNQVKAVYELLKE